MNDLFQMQEVNYVYFFVKEVPHAEHKYEIKIGHAKDPLGRLSDARTFCLEEIHLLSVIADIDAEALERRLHRRFNKDRIQSNREWFYPSCELLEFINQHTFKLVWMSKFVREINRVRKKKKSPTPKQITTKRIGKRTSIKDLIDNKTLKPGTPLIHKYKKKTIEGLIEEDGQISVPSLKIKGSLSQTSESIREKQGEKMVPNNAWKLWGLLNKDGEFTPLDQFR